MAYSVALNSWLYRKGIGRMVEHHFSYYSVAYSVALNSWLRREGIGRMVEHHFSYYSVAYSVALIAGSIGKELVG